MSLNQLLFNKNIGISNLLLKNYYIVEFQSHNLILNLFYFYLHEMNFHCNFKLFDFLYK